jgi:hypothetical protein
MIDLLFFMIREAITIGIDIARTRAREFLNAIRAAIAIGIGVVGVRAVERFFGIGQAIIVRI